MEMRVLATFKRKFASEMYNPSTLDFKSVVVILFSVTFTKKIYVVSITFSKYGTFLFLQKRHKPD